HQPIAVAERSTHLERHSGNDIADQVLHGQADNDRRNPGRNQQPFNGLVIPELQHQKNRHRQNKKTDQFGQKLRDGRAVMSLEINFPQVSIHQGDDYSRGQNNDRRSEVVQESPGESQQDRWQVSSQAEGKQMVKPAKLRNVRQVRVNWRGCRVNAARRRAGILPAATLDHPGERRIYAAAGRLPIRAGVARATKTVDVVAETNVGVPGILVIAVTRAAILSARAPATATHDIRFALRRAPGILFRGGGVIVDLVEVITPFPEVAADIIEPPRIGLLLANRPRMTSRVFVEPRKFREPRRSIAAEVRRSRSRAAGIFELRFGGQAVTVRSEIAFPGGQLITRLKTFRLGSFITEAHRVGPADLLDRVAGSLPA